MDQPTATKQCRRCGEVGNAFRPGRRVCKECDKAANRARYVADRDQRIAYARRYYADHREQARALNKRWLTENSGRRRTYEAEYRAANRDKKAEFQRQYRAENREATRALSRAAAAVRRGRLSGVTTIPFTAAQLESRLAFYGHRCWMCRAAPFAELDHVKPISKGGPHMLSNIRPACLACNRAKGARWDGVKF